MNRNTDLRLSDVGDQPSFDEAPSDVGDEPSFSEVEEKPQGGDIIGIGEPTAGAGA
jgi:hypothetical protein